MVNEQTFDWIFFAIVGIPFVFGLVQLIAPDWMEPMIRGRPVDRDVRTTRRL